MDFVQKVIKFNEIAGNKMQFDSRMLCLYIGLVLEECEEMVDAFQNDRNVDPEQSFLTDLRLALVATANAFKGGTFDYMAEGANHKEVADAGGDISVVGIGTVMTSGYEVNGVLNEIADSNLSKYATQSGEYLVLRDENGKVKKGELFFRPDLDKYKI